MSIFNYFDKTEKNIYGDPKLKVAKAIVHGLVVIIVMIVAMNSWTTVSAGHVKVRTLFGKVDHEELKEGFHIVNPFAKFSEYDGRKQTYKIDNILVPSQDKLKTDMDISIIYSLVPSQASDMKQNIGSLDDFGIKFLTPKSRSLVREVGKGVKKSQDFFLDDVQIMLQEETTEKLAKFMEAKGIVIHNVLFRDVTLPKVVAMAIIQTKQRQEEVNQEKAKLAIATQQAQQQVVQAQAKEDVAKADANARRTLADAQAYEIEQVAKATAKGNKLINKTLTKDLIEANRVEKWDGKYPTTMMGATGGVLLNVPIK